MHQGTAIILSYATNLAVFASTLETDSPWWLSLVVSLVSPIFYFFVKYLFDVMITKSKANGTLTKEQAKDLQHLADDITDDGKVNNSNKKEK